MWLNLYKGEGLVPLGGGVLGLKAGSTLLGSIKTARSPTAEALVILGGDAECDRKKLPPVGGAAALPQSAQGTL